MSEDEKILKLYEEERNHARFHESQRETCANIISGISAGLIGLITFDGEIEPIDFFPSLFIACVGLYGFVFMLKVTERRKLHFNRAYKILEQLDAKFDDLGARQFMSQADTETKKLYPVSYRISLVAVWVTYTIFIFLIGLALMTLSGIPFEA